MRRVPRFLLLLVGGLALLTWLGYGAVTRRTRSWFEKDMRLRADLAISSARQSLLARWSVSDSRALGNLLTDITRDERIMAAAACEADGRTLAVTDQYPPSFSCALLSTGAGRPFLMQEETWTETGDLPGGPVHVSVVPVTGSDGIYRGAVVLLHDMSYVARREETARNLLLAAFLILAAAAAAVAVVSARLAWAGWLSELRLALSGSPTRRFQPLVRDVRELVERLARESDGERSNGTWNAHRLHSILRQHLHGERVVIVANREPYIHERTAEGAIRVVHPASGLVTALEPVMRACSGVWVAHGSGTADRDTADAAGRIAVPPGEDSYVLRRVWLSEAEEAGYYLRLFKRRPMAAVPHCAHPAGVPGRGLGPLPSGQPEVHRRGVRRSRRAGPDHPRARLSLRARAQDDPRAPASGDHPDVLARPLAELGALRHLPLAKRARTGAPRLEHSRFHTQQHCDQFLDAVDTFLEARIDRESNAVVQAPRRTLVRPYPISIEWPVHWLAELPSPSRCREDVLGELGLRRDALLGVGVDRLDYTKGIEERLLAVDELLGQHPEFRGRFTFAQLAAPSRTRIGLYRDLSARVEALAKSINDRWGSDTYRPVILLCAHHEPPTVFRYFRASDLCYVSSLHDGMNLVAKEFVAARDDHQGVLVLSQFTGAARELTGALMVNPYDVRQAGEAIAAALRMPKAEQSSRMRAMRELVAELNVYRWAGRMLVDAAQLRRHERLSGRLSHFGTLSREPAR